MSVEQQPGHTQPETSDSSPEGTASEQISHDPAFSSVFEELTWRGLIQTSTDEKELEAALESKPLTFYCGFDPTAPSLHLGNLVQLLTMRRLQLAGHRPLALVGGATGLIGDPKQAGERVLNTVETVQQWVQDLGAQIQKFLDFEGDNAARMVNNLDWWKDVSALQLMRDIGKYFRVGSMIKKDVVASRLNSDEGISFTEFSYQLLQGYDFLRLHQDYGCLLQTGGSDQWGNLTSGTELVRRESSATAYAFATPLLTNSDGSKFGKSEGNAIWLNADMISPYAFYQFWLNVTDADVVKLLKVFTFRTKEQIETLIAEAEAAPHARIGQKALAYDVTTLVHGDRAREQAIAATDALFGQGALADLDESTLEVLANELPSATLDRDSTSIISALLATELVNSKAEARRAVDQGGAYVNNSDVENAEAIVSADQWLFDRFLIVRRGKKRTAVIRAS